MFHWAGRGKDLKSVLISQDGAAVTSVNGVTFEAHESFAQAPTLDILWVPGGAPRALEAMMRDPDGPLPHVPASGRSRREMGVLGV